VVSVASRTQFPILIILLAALTDFLDGYTARKLNAESRLGALLDPLADKIFCNTALWSIYFLKNCSILILFVAIILTIRDIILLLGSILIVSKKSTKEMKPLFISKVCTLLIFALCCISVTYGDTANFLTDILSFTCLFCAILTFYSYIKRFFNY
jgi:cardiolipin synthase